MWQQVRCDRNNLLQNRILTASLFSEISYQEAYKEKSLIVQRSIFDQFVRNS